MSLKVILFLSFAVFFTYSAASAQTFDLCFRNVSIISPEKVSPLASGKDVFVRDGKIIRITDASSSSLKASKREIDGAGKYLMAGLTDMHVHLPPPEKLEKFLKLNLAAGVTTIRSMRGKPEHFGIKSQIASGELLGPDLYIASPYFPNKTVKIEALADTVKAYKAAGYDCIKVLAVPDSAYFEALMAAANEAKIPVVGHWPWQIPIERVIESGFACIEHLQGLHEAYLEDSNSIAPLVEKLKEYRTYNCPTLDFYNVYWSQVPLNSLKGRPGLEFIDSATRADWAEKVETNLAKLTAGSGDSVVKKIKSNHEYMQSKFKLLKRMHDLGAPLIMSPADANDPFGVPGFCVWEEMKLFAKCGISNRDILKIATYNASDFLHERNRWGSVEEGKKANLILLGRNPLEAIENIESVEATVVQGRYVTKETLGLKP
jgi:imidazolonepropionase-like amidohydrolase